MNAVTYTNEESKDEVTLMWWQCGAAPLLTNADLR